MDKIKTTIRIRKSIEIVGIIDTILFSLIALFPIVTGNFTSAVVFCIPFIGLGIALILAYKRQRIVVEDDKLTFYYVIKKTRQVPYQDIRCILSIPFHNKIQKALVDQQYHRLAALDETTANLDVLFEVLKQKGIPVLDFGEMIEKNKGAAKYFNALNMMERNYYKAIVNENKTFENMSKGKMGLNITKTKKWLNIVGWILIFSNAAAFFIGGKTMLLILIAVLFVSYAMYLKYYPYMYIEAHSKKVQGLAFQMPFVGASIALLLCMIALRMYRYDFGDYMKITACVTILLAVPYLIKSVRTTVPQRLGRKSSVIFAVFVMAFAITFPINFLLTFDEPTHETTIITRKYISTAGKNPDYCLYGNWNGEEEEFSVSKSEYNGTSVGDRRRICIRRSIFGLEYYTLHK